MSEEELSPGPSTGEMGDDDTESTRTPQEENEVSPGKSTGDKAEGITETNGTSRIFLLHSKLTFLMTIRVMSTAGFRHRAIGHLGRSSGWQ